MTAFNFVVRRLPAAIWAATNPVLALNEVGVESDSDRTKVGDGITPWVPLGYSAAVVGTADLTDNGDGTYTFSPINGAPTTFGGVSVDAGQLLTLGADRKPFINATAIKGAITGGSGAGVVLVKADGTTPFTAPQGGLTPIASTDLATKGYVDGASGTALPRAGGALAGPVTTTSTFDGRSVSADGLNLDKVVTLTGVPVGSTTLGAAIGTTVSSNASLLSALTQIVSKLEAVPGSRTNVVTTIPLLQALTGMKSGDITYVQNASGDPTVSSGSAMYVYASGAWAKIAEFESIDLADVTTTTHGLMLALDKVKINYITVTQAVNLDSVASNAFAALSKSGGTMTGAIAMGGQKITGLAAGSANGDAVRYDEFSPLAALVATALPKAGGSMTGALDMGAQSLTNLAVPSANSDATTKSYVDASSATNATAISAEASARTSADTALATNIAGEAARAQAVEVLLAPKASPTFTGTVTLPTSTPTNALEAASKGYVDSTAAAAASAAGVSTDAGNQLVSGADGKPKLTGVAKIDGTTAFTAAQGGVDPTAAAHLATKNYVDTVDATIASAVTTEATRAQAAEGLLVKKDGTTPFTSPQGGVTPIAGTDLATKQYVDNAAPTGLVKADGTVPFTAVVDGVTPTANAHLSTKGYVDSGDATNATAISTEATRAQAAEALLLPKADVLDTYVGGVSKALSAERGKDLDARLTAEASTARAAEVAAQAAADAALPKAGGTMSGAINMSSQLINNVATAVSVGDAVPLGQTFSDTVSGLAPAPGAPAPTKMLLGDRSYKDLQALLIAEGAPISGRFVLGLDNGVLTLFPY